MEEFENKDTMERLKIKRQLMLDTSEIFEFFSKRIAVYKVCGRYGKKYLNNALKDKINICRGLNLKNKSPN